MEVIKTSPNVEMDVIYADGTRRRVLITSVTIDLVKLATLESAADMIDEMEALK